jgi:hypothetical protein
MSESDRLAPRSPTGQRLYQLLPAVYRIRDSQQNYPLGQLIDAIAVGLDRLKDEIGELYDNWFIETCDDQFIPYIADLVGFRRVGAGGEPVTLKHEPDLLRVLYPRAEVANTIRYRRRKGTLAVLELLARDVAGWPARAVECYALVAMLAATDPDRAPRAGTTPLSDAGAASRIGGPFDSVPHTLDVRGVGGAKAAGRYNLPGVGLYVWRLRAYPVTYARPRQLGKRSHYSFSSLGRPTPLFINPTPERDPSEIAGEVNLPAPLRRQTLRDHKAQLYGPGKSICVFRGDEPVPADKVAVADLSDWDALRPSLSDKRVVVDPELGRMIAAPRDGPYLHVSYHYGFSSDLGGGEYARQQSRAQAVRLGAGATAGEGGKAEAPAATIDAALKRWRHARRVTGSTRGDVAPDDTIGIVDSGTYPWDLAQTITVPRNRTLCLHAVRGARPTIELGGRKAIKLLANSALVLEGLLLTGGPLRVAVAGAGCRIQIRHCTLAPDGPPGAALAVSVAGGPVELTIDHSIVAAGTIELSRGGAAPAGKPGERLVNMRVTDSILGAAISAPPAGDPPLALDAQRSTLLAPVVAGAVSAINSIFAAPVAAPPVNAPPGANKGTPPLVFRFCYLHEPPNGATLQSCVLPKDGRLRFASTRYGDPDYGRLANTCPVAISQGADDGSELGAYHELYLPQRDAMLRARLEEYTVAAMRPAIFYAD